ncbi:MAG: flagellar hook-basal body complex protein, partial [Planctomycetales bacterium]|nr:flagellar hook-basal body complex protein [Planctomycetales bacterium]
MGLQSALSTALTGMNAAETSIDVTGNNVANANTVGFKESKVNFATQFLQTQSIGSAPTDSRGGTNPRQTGLGVKVAEISPEFTQGTIEISSNPLDLAVQGDGFFIVQGSNGEQYYTRNGQFKTNSDNEIVTITGQRVLGYGVDENFEIQPTGLEPIAIPLGQAAIAQQTKNVYMEGGLNPNGSIGATPEIIQSVILSDGSKEVPPDTTDYTSLGLPGESTTATASATPGSMGAGDFSYKITYVDVDGNEGPPSKMTSTVSILGGTTNSIDLGALPPPPDGVTFTSVNIYRNDSTVDSDYRLVGSVPAGTPTFNDGAAAGTTVLNDDGLSNGSYRYYVTFYDTGSPERESRPATRIGPVTVDATTSPRVRLHGIPVPTSADYDGIRIYRSLANNQNEFHLVDELGPADIGAATEISYIDAVPDADIDREDNLINLEGPDINFSLALTDVVTREGSNYVHLFEEGTLDFTGSKGGRELAERSLEITSTTTIADLLSFMEESMGVVKTATEDTFPDSVNYGGDIVDNRLQLTSNMGIENALAVNLSAFQFTPTGGGTPSTIPLTFNSSQVATDGEGASADFVVYDSLGSPLSVRITTVLESTTATEAVFRWIATSPDNAPEAGDYNTVVGTGTLTTDGNG